jgi:hypothetical protein
VSQTMPVRRFKKVGVRVSQGGPPAGLRSYLPTWPNEPRG